MTLNEMNVIVFKGKLSLVGLERMKNAGVLPKLHDIASSDLKTIREVTNEWKSTFVGRFVFKNPRYYGLIERVTKAIGKIPEWEDFTKQNIDSIIEMFQQGAPSSARTYLAMMKSVLNDAKDEVELPYARFSERMSMKATPSVGVYLNMGELKRLEEYKPESESERIILAQFLCGCYTGARHSDILQMSVDNITDGFLTYVSQKTKIQATVEAKPSLVKLLPVAGRHVYCDSVFNETIRTICEKVGIDEQTKVFRKGRYETGPKWMFVASHTARRSFATNLALLDVPILQISKRMGHASTEQSCRYIVSGTTKLDKGAMKFFS